MSHFYKINEDDTVELSSVVSTPAKARKATGKHVASITTKLEVMPSFLDEWKVMKMHEIVSENQGISLGDAKEAMWGKRLSPSGELLSSSEFGTRCHKALEDALNGSDFDPNWTDYVFPFLSYIDGKNIKTLSTELVVADDALNTAGTIDLVVELPDGKIAIMDFKTREGKGDLKSKAYPKDAAQLSACSAIYSRKHDLGYQPKIYSALIDAVTAELFVKEWTHEAQLKGLSNFVACSNFYDAINGL